MEKKYCGECKKWKTLSEFYKNRSAKDGHSYRCKECSKKLQSEYYKKNVDKRREYYREYHRKHRKKIREERKKTERVCEVCRKWKSLSEFYKDSKICTECEEYKIECEKHRGEKYCNECKQWKHLSEFGKNKNTKDGYSNRCKECKRKYAKKYKIMIDEYYNYNKWIDKI